MQDKRLWLRFAVFSILCALLPGFLFGAFLGGGIALGMPAGTWYPAMVQAHANALLMGWGGAMIFGVALHFLPRLRGARLAWPEWAGGLFWVFAVGTLLRVVGQPLRAVGGPAADVATVDVLQAAIAAGILAQAVGVFGLIAVLVKTFSMGPAMEKRKGFREILPFLIVAGAALTLGQIAWILGAVDGMASGRSLAIIPVTYQRIAVDLTLFGFVAAVSVAMSSRLFPLNFRVRLPHPQWLRRTAACLGAGVAMTVYAGVGPGGVGRVEGVAALFVAAGLVCGGVAVRVFHPRTPFPGNKRPYRILDHPAAVGALSAYVWAVIAALLLVLSALQQFGLDTSIGRIGRDVAVHAIGAGFMTLLIVAAGWTMLPGFGGGRPRSAVLIWVAVILGNVAVLLRILPGIVFAVFDSGRDYHTALFGLAGIIGFTGLLAFSVALALSLRRNP